MTGTPGHVIASRSTAVCAAAQAPWLPVNQSGNRSLVEARAATVGIAATAPWLSVNKKLYSLPHASSPSGQVDSQPTGAPQLKLFPKATSPSEQADSRPTQAARGSQDDYQEEPPIREGPFVNTADAMAARVRRVNRGHSIEDQAPSITGDGWPCDLTCRELPCPQSAFWYCHYCWRWGCADHIRVCSRCHRHICALCRRPHTDECGPGFILLRATPTGQ